MLLLEATIYFAQKSSKLEIDKIVEIRFFGNRLVTKFLETFLNALKSMLFVIFKNIDISLLTVSSSAKFLDSKSCTLTGVRVRFSEKPLFENNDFILTFYK